MGKNILNGRKALVKFLKDDNFRANERGGLLKLMVKHKIQQKRSKYVDERLTLFVWVLIL